MVAYRDNTDPPLHNGIGKWGPDSGTLTNLLHHQEASCGGALVPGHMDVFLGRATTPLILTKTPMSRASS